MITFGKEDWKQNLKDYIDTLPDDIQGLKKFKEYYQKLIDAGDGSITVRKEIDVIEIWYK